MSGNSLRQAVHTHCASVHQAAKLVAPLLRVARVTVGLAESNVFIYLFIYFKIVHEIHDNAAYRRVCDSCHLQVDCQKPGLAP